MFVHGSIGWGMNGRGWDGTGVATGGARPSEHPITASRERPMSTDDLDRVVPMDDLDDFRVAGDTPDPRGWEVVASDGRRIGEVDELLVDTSAMKVRYLDVGVDDAMSSEPD